jgi:diguanylate cyclase (GGDEF)-like protein
MQFVAIPITSPAHSYGCLFLEMPAKHHITQPDIQVLELVTAQAGMMIEQQEQAKLLESELLIDRPTGIMNIATFRCRLHEEVARANDTEIPLTLCCIHIDAYRSMDAERDEKLLYSSLNAVIDHLHESVRPYDVQGRTDYRDITLLHVGKTISDVRLWAEKARKDIARKPIPLAGKNFNITVSIGIAEYQPSQNADEFLSNSRVACDKAMKKQNTVSLFS